MARGFSTGLIHGTVAGMAVLVGALVIWPPVDLPDTGGIEPDAGAVAIRPDGAPLPDPDAALQGDKAEAQAPAAGIVDIPVGSEFGRATDLSPIAPAPLSPIASGSGAPLSAVIAPEQESLPAPATAPAERPAAVSHSVGAPSVVEASPIVTDLPLVPAEEALGAGPDQGLMPGRFIPSGPDSSPQHALAPMVPSTEQTPPVLPDLSNLPNAGQLSLDLANAEADSPPVEALQTTPVVPTPPARDLGMPKPELSLPPAIGGLGLGGAS